jgi:hypothetical protein
VNPTRFVEKAREYTAVQWDGSDESAAWIVEKMPGTSYVGDTIVVRDPMDRQQELPAGSWVVLLAGTSDGPAALVYDETSFERTFQPAGA